MSVLIDALKKAEERKETKEETNTSHFNEFSESFLNEPPNENDKLVLVEISNNEELKTSFSDSEQLSELSSLDDWNSQNIEKNNDLSKSLSSSDAHQKADFTEIKKPFGDNLAPFQNDEANSTSSNWADDFLPEFKQEVQELEENNALETESEQSTNWNQESLFNEFQDDDIKTSQFNNLNSIPETSKTSTIEESSQKFPPSNQLTFPKTRVDSKQIPDFDKENSSPSTPVTNEISLDDKWFAEPVTPPQPETAQRIFAANARPPSSTSKRTLGLLGVLAIVAICMGYLFSLPTGMESSPIKFQNPINVTQQTVIKPAIEEEQSTLPAWPIVTPSVKPHESPTIPTQSNELVEKSTQPPNPQPKSVDLAEKEKTTQKILATASVALPTKTPQSQSQERPSLKSTPVPKVNPSVINLKQAQLPKKRAPLDSQKAEALQLTETSSPSKPAEIKALQKKVHNKLNQELLIGYQALQRGDNKKAAQAYQTVLQQNPNNRDAMLGLGALALRKGNKRLAQSYYRQILQLYPQDPHAQVGLINTLNNRSPKSESQLKLLLEQTPQSAHINFSLGNLYANQGQWAKAQQAYFEAYRYANNQADYAYNLAISLDHLNQPQVALGYYQKALQLAPHQVVNFNPNAAQKRIQTLQSHTRRGALAKLPTEY